MILKYPIITKPILFFSIFLIFLHTTIAQNDIDPLETDDVLQQKMWVDSIMKDMGVREKIAQLFMVPAYSNKDSIHQKNIEKLIIEYKIGGLIFMQGSPVKQLNLTNQYQSKSEIPLLIGFDGEWGLNMRLDSTYRYPWNLTLGAVIDNTLLEKLGQRIGEQCVRMGIHMNFAPVVDINTNPSNPIIGNRSFSSDKVNVNEKARAFMKGLQSQKVLACAKHFPGHGETNQDSHKTLPKVNLHKRRLFEVELYPYKKLIFNGLTGVMTAHLNVPALAKNDSIPASISPEIIENILKNKLNFKGLIVTDALNMKGASNFTNPGKLDLLAFLAGNDILLFSENVPAAIDTLLVAFEQKIFDLERLDYSVRKILKSKYWSGLHHYKPIDAKNLTKELNTVEDEILHRQLVDKSITLLKNDQVYPIKNVSNRIAYVKLGDDDAEPFFKTLRKYAPVEQVELNDLNKLKDFEIVIVGFHKSNDHPWKSFKFSDDEINQLNEIALHNKVILDVFSSPYCLLNLDTAKNIEGIVVSYQNSKYSQEISAQKIFGALETNGILSVSLNDNFPFGMGLHTKSLGRLSYGLPEEVGMSTKKLEKIDSLAQVVIDQKMAPGMQILVARNGKVIYQKNFGTHTYNNTSPVTDESIYDLASVTKITAGLPMMMKAFEENEFELEDSLVKLFPYLKNTNKEHISFKDVLSHNGKLKAWIPFYKNTLDSTNKFPSEKYYRSIYSENFPIKVAENLYTLKSIQDTIFQSIITSELQKTKEYRYSDLFFTLYKDYVQRKYNKPLNLMVDSLFYKPMGAYSLTYNPLEKFKKEIIVPTEIDEYFRHQLLQGNVHDMAAAMLGGVSGHAGLFGNANDVAKMMQMYLQEGYYGGKYFFKKTTINTFNKRYYENEGNRRALGFDKPQLDPNILATCGCVSHNSFGHSGFTGIYTWADPESGILYAFLSNRVYPTMENNKMVDSNIRTMIQQVIQDALIN